MRILLAHTYYKQPGGEDRVFSAETDLLRRQGHQVLHYCQHNDATDRMSPLRLAARTLWSSDSYEELRGILRRERPDVCHFHNTFPVMSPAVFYAARAEQIPVVATLHNYRLLCPSATLLRNSEVCEDCVSRRLPWPAVAHSCYRGSRSASAATALMLTAHRMLGSWEKSVDVWIALTDFARRKFIDGGIPAERIAVKPNFVPSDPGASWDRDDFALFAGRLSPEKGIATLLSAWAGLQAPMRLKIAGDGPMRDAVVDAARGDARIEYLGPLPAELLKQQMKRAAVLVFPSIWYEGLPLTILEAYATGLPVVASRIGSISRLVLRGETGLHFEPGNAADLAARIGWCWQNRASLSWMGREARRQYLAGYTPESNYPQLMEIYARAIRRAPAEALRNQNQGADQGAVVDEVPAAHRAART